MGHLARTQTLPYGSPSLWIGGKTLEIRVFTLVLNFREFLESFFWSFVVVK